MRAPFQVLIFPYRKRNDGVEVLIGKRADSGDWQGISGGGEEGETLLEAAKRELTEEASLTGKDWVQLDATCMVPKHYFSNNELWHDHPYVIPEHTFMVAVDAEATCSEEHSELCWASISEASALVRYDSNRVALWEVEQRLDAETPVQKTTEPKISAIMIHAKDYQQGFDWYQKAFPNAKIIQVEEYDYKYLKVGAVSLEIVQADDKVNSGAAGSVVYWQASNFDERLNDLEGLGAQLYRGPKVIEHGVRMCQVMDPFGNLIGLRETRTNND